MIVVTDDDAGERTAMLKVPVETVLSLAAQITTIGRHPQDELSVQFEDGVACIVLHEPGFNRVLAEVTWPDQQEVKGDG